MDDDRFDEMAKSLIAATSRRRTVGALLGGVVGLIGLAEVGSSRRRKNSARRRKEAKKEKLGKRVTEEAKPGGAGKPSGRCLDGFANCRGTCVNLAKDRNNCGICALVCPDGESCCAGVCLATQTDNANCGACGKNCAAQQTCCGGACVNTQVNESHCGTCDTPCGARQICCGGECIAACTASDQCHEAGVCDPATRACTNPRKPNGAACTDGDACTRTDTCQAGECVGGNPVICPTPDQCHDPGACNPATGLCSNPSKPDGTSCETGNLCTIDACQGGVCTPGASVTCTNPGPCESSPGACDPGTGQCSYQSTCSSSLQQICCPPDSPNRPNQCGNADGIGCNSGQFCCSGQCAGPSTGTGFGSCGPPV